LVRSTILAALVAIAGCGASAPLPPTVSPADPPATTASSAAVRDLQQDLTRLFGDPAAPSAVWGVQIRSSDRDETLYSLNQRTLLIPASTIKLVTLAAAASGLGWDFRFDTELIADGSIDDGVLIGDLVVRGTGDPSIGRRKSSVTDVPDDPFASWADALKTAGIHRISGRVVGDDRAMENGSGWSGHQLGDGWTWNDLAFGFAAPGGALTFHENVTDLIIEPGTAPERPATARVEQPASGLQLTNHVVTGPTDGEVVLHLLRLPGQSTLEVRGSIPLGSAPVRRSVSVDDPTLFFLRTLRQTLVREGIAVDGTVIDVDDLASATTPDPAPVDQVLIRHQSPPLSEVAVDMMKRSQNLFAETLFRTLGSMTGDGTVAASQATVRDLLSSWSIDTDQFIIADGSGLSRYNYLTPEALVGVLEHVRSDRRSAAIFEATLPVAGRDGTLAARMEGTAAAGNARAKTGTMSNVSALSGFVDTRDGETLTFAILANNYQSGAAEITRIIDQAVASLARFAR
jgi:D-alanyl-D-alanine carboxypeptidase/D-alanyl-D-alanine-endopeptidase (penicillin-binding protein 4)